MKDDTPPAEVDMLNNAQPDPDPHDPENHQNPVHQDPVNQQNIAVIPVEL